MQLSSLRSRTDAHRVSAALLVAAAGCIAAGLLPLPVSSPASLPSPRFAHIAAQSHRIQVHHPLRAVIPLVGQPLRCLVPPAALVPPSRPLPSGSSPWSACPLDRLPVPHRDNPKSTACRCVRPSFILVIRASASCGCFHPVRSFGALAVQFGQIFPSRNIRQDNEESSIPREATSISRRVREIVE